MGVFPGRDFLVLLFHVSHRSPFRGTADRCKLCYSVLVVYTVWIYACIVPSIPSLNIPFDAFVP